MLMAMESSCIIFYRLIRLYEAAAALPAHLNDATILDKQRNIALTASQFAHAAARFRVRFDVILNELATAELEPVPHFLRVRAARGSKQLKLGHG
jgi:hypothetical protein